MQNSKRKPAPEPVIVARTYRDLLVALRARAERMHVSREELDALGGLASGHAAKLLTPIPVKALGPISLEAMLRVLDLEIVIRQRQHSPVDNSGKPCAAAISVK